MSPNSVQSNDQQQNQQTSLLHQQNGLVNNPGMPHLAQLQAALNNGTSSTTFLKNYYRFRRIFL